MLVGNDVIPAPILTLARAAQVWKHPISSVVTVSGIETDNREAHL